MKIGDTFQGGKVVETVLSPAWTNGGFVRVVDARQTLTTYHYPTKVGPEIPHAKYNTLKEEKSHGVTRSRTVTPEGNSKPKTPAKKKTKKDES